MRHARKRGMTTTQTVVVGFLITILIGSLLLSMPIVSADGGVIPWMDSMFMSAVATCVTGMVSTVHVLHWNWLGQLIILILVQIGGFGVVTFSTIILILLGRRITLKERVLIHDYYDLDTLQGVVKLVIRIMRTVFVIEGLGAVALSFHYIPEFGFLSGVWKAVFHSVSALCNAGLTLLGDDSLVRYRGNVLMNLTTSVLVIIGGTGFPVWWDVMRVFRNRDGKRKGFKRLFGRLELHSKLVLVISAILIVAGAFGIFLLESSNPNTIGNLPFGEKLMASLFQSVHTRTSGFFTIQQGNFREATAFLCIILMFIGGSPTSAAGGIKTVTVGMVVLAVISIIRGKEDTEVFHRKISGDNVKKGMALILLSFAIMVVSTALMCMIQDADFLDILYEVVAALSTTGLSRELTPNLNVAGKVILMVNMCVGRIGPISMALFFSTKKGNKNIKSYPVGKIRVG